MSTKKTIIEIEKKKAQVVGILSIFSYEKKDIFNNLKNYSLYCLTTINSLLDELVIKNKISYDIKNKIKQFINGK